jgi:hypothetical protein
MNGLANGLYGGITDQSLSGIDNGTGYGVASGMYGGDKQELLKNGLVFYVDASRKIDPFTNLTWKDNIQGFNLTRSANSVYSSLNNGSFYSSGVLMATSAIISTQIPLGNNPRTVQSWFKLDSLPASFGVLVGWGTDNGNGNLFNLTITNTGVLYLWGSSYNYTSSFIVPVNKWFNVAASFDGSLLFISLDGVTDNGFSRTYNTQVSQLGVIDNRLSGAACSKVLIYNRCLSKEEIRYNYQIDRIKYTS